MSIVYIPHAPDSPNGFLSGGEVINYFHTRAEAVRWYRKCQPLRIKRANAAGIDWKIEYITKVNRSEDLS